MGAVVRRGGFVESVRAHLTLGLGSDGAGCLGVLARRALGVCSAGVGLYALFRSEGLEKTLWACLTSGLRSVSFFDVLAGRTRD